MIIPRLNTNQKIAFINVSDSPAKITNKNIESGISRIKNLGFEVEFSQDSILTRMDSKKQAFEFNKLVKREEIGCIICTSGGTNCISILPYIDYNLLTNNPKVVMGTSDCSHLLQAITHKTNVVTIDGPVVNRLGEWSQIGEAAFVDYCIQDKNIIYNKPEEWHIFSEGSAKGISLSGNIITTLSMLFLLNKNTLDNTILFIEDHSNENEEMIQYWFSVLQEKGVFESIKGVVFGTFSTCSTLGITQILYNKFFKDLNIPVIQTDLFGIKNYCPIPIGANCSIDTTQETITFYCA
ncbi:hypothetical protein HN512_04775 [Candidatus Peregrinibacteria bacterium]|jgi:muramoyltetrapeptide carboxypeptidase|nr:hypothetical protein [Candidatus Peregrinibacteria bacterium]MBT3599119.1 hypothetical protein [Candidatus Peregrinibacteria bacterium]MBT4367507.1 hypothetical protein [Candidatus Peregrinibacteria bacterium]MBT6730759.1 hypothetical protein [Candidatus Peregrinibacteria bacterium]MBT7008909.1 hypothetical protein [Candidatus Peregrinibacteria bacterium]